MVKIIRYGFQYGFLDPIDTAMWGSWYDIAFTGDSLFLQGLEEQIGLTGRDYGIGTSMQKEERCRGAGNVMNGIGLFGCFRVGQDPSIPTPEDAAAIYP